MQPSNFQGGGGGPWTQRRGPGQRPEPDLGGWPQGGGLSSRQTCPHRVSTLPSILGLQNNVQGTVPAQHCFSLFYDLERNS